VRPRRIGAASIAVAIAVALSGCRARNSTSAGTPTAPPVTAPAPAASTSPKPAKDDGPDLTRVQQDVGRASKAADSVMGDLQAAKTAENTPDNG